MVEENALGKNPFSKLVFFKLTDSKRPPTSKSNKLKLKLSRANNAKLDVLVCTR